MLNSAHHTAQHINILNKEMSGFSLTTGLFSQFTKPLTVDFLTKIFSYKEINYMLSISFKTRD